jgi:alkanesulfonate monooxygenase SsuD/methylene tetrahydromethanopterin reductase-like flavin-dependent oxidoreductase (luciferase family)
MKVGVFDHLDSSGAPLGEFYEDRLRLLEAYDRSRLHAYHCAEHHATPLGLSPSPSVFLAAAVQRTRRLLLGPLVYTLALYHPLRLAEEICMLDQMSGGRLQLGVGRGISPFELGYFGADPKKSQAMYIEAFAVICQALGSKSVTHEGEFYSYRDVPIQLEPVQRPRPPLWYGLGNLSGVEWCVRNGVNVVSNAQTGTVREVTDRYRALWAAAGHDAASIPFMGTTRHVVIAPTRAEALAAARRAYLRWHGSFMFLWRKHGAQPQFASFPDTFDELLERGQAAAGTPQEVLRMLSAQAQGAGVNYLLCRFAFGDLSFEESLRSLLLFNDHVMPALEEICP